MIGREKEKKIFQELCIQERSAFVSLYGRRRIGKTYFVKEYFKEHASNCLFFEYTGIYNTESKKQIPKFMFSIKRWLKYESQEKPKDWLEAFEVLTLAIEASKKTEKIVIFIDELPWVAQNTRSGFIEALGWFWNSIAEYRDDIILIVCGSNASWINKNILQNKGPLHNRITTKIAMQPFTLKETESFLEYKGFLLDKKSIVELYMCLGGVAKYLDFLDARFSIDENISELLFNINGNMFGEFEELFESLFSGSEGVHTKIVDALIENSSNGLSFNALAQKAGLQVGSTLQNALDELIKCDFVMGINKFGAKNKFTHYMLIDPYCRFYGKWLKPLSYNRLSKLDLNYWLGVKKSQSYISWAGLAFETVCIKHIKAYLAARSSAANFKEVFYWDYKAKTKEEVGVELDFVVQYENDVYDIVECKFYHDELNLTKAQAQNLKEKQLYFFEKGVQKKRCEIKLVLLSSYGVKRNQYFNSLGIAQSIEIEEMFR